MRCLLILTLLFLLNNAQNYCISRAELIDPYLQSQSNLRCRHGSPIDVSNSLFCSDNSDKWDEAYDTDFYVICEDGYTLLGYGSYQCLNGDLASDLTTDPVLSPYSACVASDALENVCVAPSTASSTSKVLVEADVSVGNVDLVSLADESTVYYKLACAAGYDFKDEVVGDVYGYCNDNTDGNNGYGYHGDSGADGCYALCPADGPLSSVIDNFDGIEVDESRSGAVHEDVEPMCAEGYDIGFEAPHTYTFTCDGVLEGVDSGEYSCVDCPICLPKCPPNPDISSVDNLVSISAASSQSGEVLDAIPICQEGFAIADDAQELYQFSCESVADGGANSGVVSTSGDVPVCLPVCPATATPDIANVASVSLVEAGPGAIVEGTIVCNSGYSHPHGHPEHLYFQCVDEEFSCVGDCPKCEADCVVAAVENELFSYNSLDGEELAVGESVISGEDVVKVDCKELSLVGEPYMSCIEEELIFLIAEPVCEDVVVCAAPQVHNAQISSTDNIRVGDTYTVNCREDSYFDVVIARDFGVVNSFTAAVLECNGEVLPEQYCYSGCLVPDFAGEMTPDMRESGGAPYYLGQVVSFKCPEGLYIQEEAEVECVVGGMTAPECGSGCATFSFSLLLYIALLSYSL